MHRRFFQAATMMRRLSLASGSHTVGSTTAQATRDPWGGVSRWRNKKLSRLSAAHGTVAGLNRHVPSEADIGPGIHDAIERQPEHAGHA